MTTQQSVGKKYGIVVAIFAAIAFGLYPPAAQLAYAHSANVSLVIIFTTFVRALSLLLFCRWKGLSLAIPPEKIRSILSAGFFQALSVIGIISSLKYIPGPVTITIIFSSTSLLLVYLWSFRCTVRKSSAVSYN
jgi:drug/metabolite transporter (DMT)-like permease